MIRQVVLVVRWPAHAAPAVSEQPAHTRLSRHDTDRLRLTDYLKIGHEFRRGNRRGGKSDRYFKKSGTSRSSESSNTIVRRGLLCCGRAGSRRCTRSGSDVTRMGSGSVSVRSISSASSTGGSTTPRGGSRPARGRPPPETGGAAGDRPPAPQGAVDAGPQTNV